LKSSHKGFMSKANNPRIKKSLSEVEGEEKTSNEVA
jgi:hypothetical protein